MQTMTHNSLRSLKRSDVGCVSTRAWFLYQP